MATVKVRYSVQEMLTYSGTFEMDEEEYNNMKDEEDDTLGELILDRVDRRNPSNCSVDSVDEFELVKE